MWNVLYTKSRAEKKVAESLKNIGVNVYCPVVEQFSQWSDRKKKITKPLLPSMVLVKNGTFNDADLFRFNGVVRFMSYKGKRARVTDKEVEVLDDFVHGNYSLNHNTISIGDNVEVPVLNKEGKVIKIEGNACWVQLANAGLIASFSLK
jgi:transcription antitermination factor NusG